MYLDKIMTNIKYLWYNSFTLKLYIDSVTDGTKYSYQEVGK